MLEVWLEFVSLLKTIDLFDIIDVLIVAFIIYQIIKLVKETRAEQLIKGMVAVLLLFLFAHWLNIKTLKYLVGSVLRNAVLALLVVFQPELRRALEQLGRSKLSGLNVFSPQNEEAVGRIRLIRLIDAIGDGCAFLSKQKMGALIVIERTTKLGEIIKTGTVIDSDPSMELIGSVFFTNSPLHDGAMVIRGGKIYAAGCFLPLSDNANINRTLGTRHRAALGMSENSDALVIVVSEETGVISLARNGKLERNYTLDRLNEELRTELLSDNKNENGERKSSIWKVKKQ